MAENTTTAEAAMNVTEPEATTQEVSVDSLMENLDNPPVEQEPTQAEEQAEGTPGEETQEEPSPEEARRNAIVSGLTALQEEGWTHDELDAFTKDATVHADIAAGKSVERAAMAYLRRSKTSAQTTKAPAKKGVPTVQSATGAARKTGSRISEMSDKEFDELSKRARQAMLDGKEVRFD